MAKKCKPCDKPNHTKWKYAVAAALHNSARYGVPYRIYKCPAGSGGWHLTTK